MTTTPTATQQPIAAVTPAEAHPAPRTASPDHGLLLALLSAAAFATSGPMAASLLDVGWSPGAASLVRIGGGALVLLPFTVAAVIRRRPSTQDVRLASLYGVVAVAGAQFSFFNAMQYLSVGVALLLEYLAPILIVLFVWGRTGQTPQKGTVVGTIVSLVGLVLVLDLSATGGISLVGVAWGLFAALCLSSYFIISARELPTISSLTMAGIGMATGGAAIALLGLLGVMPMTLSAAPVELLGTPLSWVVPAGVLILVPTVLAYSIGIVATQRLGSRLASFVGLTEVLFAVLFAWLLVDQLPTGIQLLGGVSILAGVALVKTDRAAA